MLCTQENKVASGEQEKQSIGQAWTKILPTLFPNVKSATHSKTTRPKNPSFHVKSQAAPGKL